MSQPRIAGSGKIVRHDDGVILILTILYVTDTRAQLHVGPVAEVTAFGLSRSITSWSASRAKPSGPSVPSPATIFVTFASASARGHGERRDNGTFVTPVTRSPSTPRRCESRSGESRGRRTITRIRAK